MTSIICSHHSGCIVHFYGLRSSEEWALAYKYAGVPALTHFFSQKASRVAEIMLDARLATMYPFSLRLCHLLS